MSEFISYDEMVERKVSSNHNFVEKAVAQLAAEKLRSGEPLTTSGRLLARLTAISEVIMDQQAWLTRQLIEIEWSIKEASDPKSPVSRERNECFHDIHTLSSDMTRLRDYFIRDSDYPNSQFQSEVEGAMYSALRRR